MLTYVSDDFFICALRAGDVVEFRVVPICTRSPAGAPATFGRLGEEKTHPAAVETPVVIGNINVDGCANWFWQTPLHLCDREDADKIARLLLVLYDIADEMLHPFPALFKDQGFRKVAS